MPNNGFEFNQFDSCRIQSGHRAGAPWIMQTGSGFWTIAFVARATVCVRWSQKLKGWTTDHADSARGGRRADRAHEGHA